MFLQTGRSISFLRICTWNVLGFKENHVKVKLTQGAFICFPVISLKSLIANWDALIPFLLVSFFCLKSNFFPSNIFYVRSPGTAPFLSHRPLVVDSEVAAIKYCYQKLFTAKWKLKLKLSILFCKYFYLSLDTVLFIFVYLKLQNYISP